MDELNWESQLGEQDEDDQLVARLERLWSGDSPQVSAGAAAKFSRPPFAGRFDLGQVIGAGAFGVVYLAVDLASGELVALKLPRAEVLLDEQMLKRFATEARLASRLSHPNIVRLREAQTTVPDCYIASDYCDGPDLQKWLSESAPPVLDWQAVARFMALVASAVHYAHENGVCHRDLKPANILLVPVKEEDQGGGNHTQAGAEAWLDQYEPKLTDFGLGRLSELSLTATRSSFLAGTPIYMAPELFDSREGTSGFRQVDIYSLGVIVFELLTRRLPIEGHHYSDFVDGHRHARPQQLSSFRRDLPRSLQRICSKCLEKNPRVRYQTAGELAEDLQTCAEGRSPTIVSARWRDRFAYWSKRPSRIEIAGWFQIWSSLILCSWMLIVVNLSPWFMQITDADLWSLRRDVFQLAAIRTPIYIWLAYQVIRMKPWAVWTMAYVNTIRALLVLRMLGQPVFFLPLYGTDGLMPFVDHLICLIILTIQAVLNWFALTAFRAQRQKTLVSESA